MAFQTVWYQTSLDESLLEKLQLQLDKDNVDLTKALTGGPGEASLNAGVRNSKIGWWRSEHWISSLIWYYVERANRENFRYDINHIDEETMQYTIYEPGQHYGWHSDDSIATKAIWPPAASGDFRPDWTDAATNQASRKLSFSLILSDPSEYEGGQLQMLDFSNRLYEVTQEKGLLVIFDSTTIHRVRPVKKGTRKSLVGWVVGPRWR